MQAEKLLRIFGENIRERRQAKDLTQEQLASLLGTGVAGSYVSDVENGKKAVNLRTVAAFSQALRVQPNALMTATSSATMVPG